MYGSALPNIYHQNSVFAQHLFFTLDIYTTFLPMSNYIRKSLFYKLLGTRKSQDILSFIPIILSSFSDLIVSFLRFRRLHLIHVCHSPD